MAELNLEEILLTGFARLPEKSVLFSKYNGHDQRYLIGNPLEWKNPGGGL